MVIHGCLTDPNHPGTEKLCVSALRPDVGCKPKFMFESDDISTDYAAWLPANGCLMVKGWSRAVCAITVLLCGFEKPSFWEAGAKFPRLD